MPQFFSFFIILLTAVLFSSLIRRIRVPWVVALIIGGFIIGPHGLKFFEANATIDFLAAIGLVFLMFMAGLETKFSDTKGIKKKIGVVALLSGGLPALVGVAIGLGLGYAWPTAILLGIIFMSSSIALLIPSFQSAGIISSQFGKMIIGATILIDIASLILLSLFLQSIAGDYNFLIILLYPLLILFLGALAWILPKIRQAFGEYAEEEDLFERELRFVLLILIGLVVLFEFLGLHAIIAGFFAGFILSGSVQTKIARAKLHAVSYGLFIPLFFVVIGSNINLSVLQDATLIFPIAIAVVIGSIGSKFISGWLSGKILGFTAGESAFLGASTIPSLSTTLAVAFLGFNQGILTQELLTSVVLLSIVTSIVSPFLVGLFSKRIESQKTLLRGLAEKEIQN
ncbi:MAG TPA: cation:proton antiporter [Candidatus Paceibacterota bacterium]